VANFGQGSLKHPTRPEGAPAGEASVAILPFVKVSADPGMVRISSSNAGQIWTE